jgi:hypothetical protein
MGSATMHLVLAFLVFERSMKHNRKQSRRMSKTSRSSLRRVWPSAALSSTRGVRPHEQRSWKRFFGMTGHIERLDLEIRREANE